MESKGVESVESIGGEVAVASSKWKVESGKSKISRKRHTSKIHQREWMGVEPTGRSQSGPTVLKTAATTGPPPPPKRRGIVPEVGGDQ